jgi:hypothetical protein
MMRLMKCCWSSFCIVMVRVLLLDALIHLLSLHLMIYALCFLGEPILFAQAAIIPPTIGTTMKATVVFDSRSNKQPELQMKVSCARPDISTTGSLVSHRGIHTSLSIGFIDADDTMPSDLTSLEEQSAGDDDELRAWTRRVQKFYSIYCPSKTNTCRATAIKFKGKEEDMFVALYHQYKVDLPDQIYHLQ